MSEVTAKPNPDDFQKNERAGEYEVVFAVSGEIRATLKAADVDDARSKADVMALDEGFGRELDEADEVSVQSVRKTAVMFLVTRDGQSMQVSHLKAGDAPRGPDERGF